MPKAQAAGAPVGDAELAADVKAQLAQLGLGAGGAFNDAAFDDFAPEKAHKRIAKREKARKAKEDSSKQQPAERRQDAAAQADSRQQRQQQQQGGRQLQEQGGRHRDAREQQRQGHGGGREQQPAGRPQRRSWQGDGEEEEAAEQGPKIPNAKSILPKDEPAIWHEAAAALPTLPPAKAEASPDVVQQRRSQAERLLLMEEQAFEQSMERRSGADAKWLLQVRRGGTTADRVAAMSVLVQDGAIANLASLDSLLAMCSKRGGARAVVISAMDALKELFMSVLLPDRKLRYFEQQPLDKAEAGKEGERRLLYWLVEDGIKKRYATFVEALESCSRDSLEFIKDRAVKSLFELLSSKPEQEVRLLSALVNKLGDPDRKLASKVGYLLTKLLAEHPGMNVVVLREIERFMFRPGLQERARYYCVVYLNQMVLSHRQQQQGKAGQGSLARRLIDVYFTVFRMILDGKIGTAAQLNKAQQDKAADAAAKKKRGEAAKAKAADAARLEAEAASKADTSGEMDGRMLSALITGVRRAFPYVPAEEVEPLIEAHADALFRLVHARSFGVATQALLLLFQLMSSRSTVSDRFYRALYAAMSSSELHRSTKGPMFLSLLFKALKADVSSRRSAAFAKRLLQVAQESPPHFACGCLLMLSELLKARPALWASVLQAEEGDGDGLEYFKDAPDGDTEGGSAAADKAVAASGKQGKRKGAKAAGSKAAEAEAAVGGKRGGDSAAEEEAGESSEEEQEEEVEEEEEELAAAGGLDQEEEAGSGAAAIPGSGLAAAAAAAAKLRVQQAAAAAASRWPASSDAYDMNKREPLFCNADQSCLWELTSLASHVHPSVATMARTVLAGQSVMYDGDPLRDLTLSAFLEKFVQKKAKAATKGDSAMQPLAAQQAAAAAASGVPQQWAALAGAQALALKALADKDVRPDDLFFHKFYNLQAVRDKAQTKKKKPKADGDELLSDAESDDSDAADDFLAGEEEGGDEGIGADPDRHGMDYDYAELAAAMDSDSGDDDGGEAAEISGGSGGSDSEPVSGSGSGSDGEEGSEEEGGSGGRQLVASFSDMSGSEEEDEEGGSSSGEEGGLSDPEAGDSDSSDGEFEAQLAAGDLLSDDEADSGSSSSSEEEEDDDAAADAEVAALIRKHRIKALPAGATAASDEEEEALNPFELAEPSSSEDEEQQQQQKGGRQLRPGKQGKRAAAAEAAASSDVQYKQKQKKRKSDSASIFAAADDYEEAIERDLADAAGLDDGQQPEEEQAQQAGSRRASGGRGRGDVKRSSGGGGRGSGGKRPRRVRAPSSVINPRYQGKVSGQMGTVITKPQLEGNKDCDCVLEVLNEQLAEERSKQARQHKDMHGANWHTVSDEDISLPGPSSPAPAVPPQVMHTPKTIERQGPESSHAAPDLRWTKHTVQEAQRAACVKAAHPDKPRAGSWIELWRQAFQGSEEPTCYAAECTAAGKSGSHLWLVSSDQGQFNHEHCYIAPLCNTHSKSNRFKHPAGDFMLKSNVTLIRIVPHPTQVPGSRTCALDDSAAVSKIAVAGKVTEAPMKNLSIKPVAGRLVTASRPSIRPEIPDDPPSPQSPVCPVLLLPYAARPATIRTEVKSWTHKHTDLGCEVYPLRRTSQGRRPPVAL
ncbi:hypothetical protein D9Q98_009726 [Chlorella vulgaris]|uniref:CCAAT-binding factor domain-containing protein n=1 Tax=Chlorella vulgaris TaxID=3077 RepID=A0A9D4YSI1_CHLVU|nr:hypothetical protein D9Q98_009726 [Chlorella vulgaris]